MSGKENTTDAWFCTAQAEVLFTDAAKTDKGESFIQRDELKYSFLLPQRTTFLDHWTRETGGEWELGGVQILQHGTVKLKFNLFCTYVTNNVFFYFNPIHSKANMDLMFLPRFTIYYEMNWPCYLLHIDLPHEIVCLLLEVYAYYINDGVTKNHPWNDCINQNNASDMIIPS